MRRMSLSSFHRLLTRGFFLLASTLAGCSGSDDKHLQGYVEGEFVYVASPQAGKLVSLKVQRGMQVKANDKLFSLEESPEKALRDEAERRVAQAKSELEDARKGKRPSEIAALEAQLAQAEAAAEFSELELVRIEKLVRSKAATIEEFDQKRSIRDQDRKRVSQAQADLQTAKLGSRADQIAAAEEDVRALTAALAKAEWDLSQKQQAAHQAGQVFDTLYREGEWVAAGKPVVILLPPGNIKVRAFVPEERIGAIHQGDALQVRVDGVDELFAGKVSYVSPRAEYTPPVIYSQETRGKLVFMIELIFDPKAAAKLHPGQPVEVQWKP